MATRNFEGATGLRRAWHLYARRAALGRRQSAARLSLIRSEKLQVRGLISHVVKPAELGDAYRGMLTEKDTYRGVVVDWR